MGGCYYAEAAGASAQAGGRCKYHPKPPFPFSVSLSTPCRLIPPRIAAIGHNVRHIGTFGSLAFEMALGYLRESLAAH